MIKIVEYEIHKINCSHFQEASRNLMCALVCPIKRGLEQVKCREENCDIIIREQSTVQTVPESRRLAPSEPVVSERVDEKVAASLLDMGASLLSAATNILTDIAFIKLKILQGLFSRPDCWVNRKNDDNQCISKLCNYTEQKPKVYMDNFGVCISNQARKWIIKLHNNK